jgi:flagellar biosynthesis protein FlhA
MPTIALPAWLSAARPGTDVALALGVAALLAVLVVPLPVLLLDAGLALSITLSVLVLMTALFLRRPLDFTSFPQLLLLTTLLRLALNVATTRTIPTRGHEGPSAAGHVVSAFGGFLMGGDVVVGFIVFAILLVVNFMVVTKGSGRIAEVAARFSLDALPGKQMAIDADLSSGLIDEAEARRRRKELEEGTGFYGAMDGAAKFVRGDAVAGLSSLCPSLPLSRSEERNNEHKSSGNPQDRPQSKTTLHTSAPSGYCRMRLFSVRPPPAVPHERGCAGDRATPSRST